jgi:hypothetical protein
LTDFADTATNKVNGLLIKAQKKFDLFDLAKGYGLVKDYSRLTVTVTQSDDAALNWQDRVRVGFICALIFIALVVCTFCIVPNIYLLMTHFSINRR